jgi:hypothetical protein
MTFATLRIIAGSGSFIFFTVALGDSGLGIISSMNVRFLVADPLGRRTGFDAITRHDTTEIPSSRYSVQPVGELEHGGEKEIRKFVTSFGTGTGMIEGPYIISVFGEKAGEFWLSISVYREPVSEDFNVRGTIHAGEMKTYRLNYREDLSAAISIDTVGSK